MSGFNRRTSAPSVWTRALVAGALLLGASSGIAQVRSALIKNVDEPGRTPYQVTVVYSQAGCVQNCTSFKGGIFPVGVSTFDAPVVPAGKRLVLLEISALSPFRTFTGDPSFLKLNAAPMDLSAAADVKWLYGGSFTVHGSYAYMNAAMYVLIEPGDSPHVAVSYPYVNDVAGAPDRFQVVLSGYLIDATN